MVASRLFRTAGAYLTICPFVMCGGERGDGRVLSRVSVRSMASRYGTHCCIAWLKSQGQHHLSFITCWPCQVVGGGGGGHCKQELKCMVRGPVGLGWGRYGALSKATRLSHRPRSCGVCVVREVAARAVHAFFTHNRQYSPVHHRTANAVSFPPLCSNGQVLTPLG